MKYLFLLLLLCISAYAQPTTRSAKDKDGFEQDPFGPWDTKL